MRIRTTACLLATTSLVSLAHADTGLTGVDSNQIIQFVEDDFRGDGPNNPNASIFSAQRYNTLDMKLFHWGARQQQVSAVNIVDSSFNVKGGTGIKAVRGLVARQTSPATPPGDVPNSLPPIPMTFTSTPEGGTVTIQGNEFASLAGLIANFTPLYFEAIWGSSKSYSRAFTVTSEPVEDLTWVDYEGMFLNITPLATESSAATTTMGPLIPTFTSTPTGAGELPPAATAVSTGGTSTSKLSTGAIAGIAVACGIVGLALVGGLIWWFCLRKPKAATATVPYGESQNRTQEMMHEKELNAGMGMDPGTDASPHSPYSDDGAGGINGGAHPVPFDQYQHHSYQEQQYVPDHIMQGGAAGMAPADFAAAQQPYFDHEHSYSPYAEPLGTVRPSSTQRGSVAYPHTNSVHLSEYDADSPHYGIRSTTATSQYAHLVEDGMTEEEIRRMEDEERQLDAAIQQAGGR